MQSKASRMQLLVLVQTFGLKSFFWRKALAEHYLISLLISGNSIRLFQALLSAVVLVTGLVVAKDCLDRVRQLFLFGFFCF